MSANAETRPPAVPMLEDLLLENVVAARAGAVRRNSMTCLEAAALVLKDFPRGLTAKQLMQRIYNRDLWKSPKGVTPDGTVSVAMKREIWRKGAASRFAKGKKRGLFVANPNFKAPAAAGEAEAPVPAV